MPKKKSKPRKTPSQRRRHQGGAPHRPTPAAGARLLAELEQWARELDLYIEDSTWLVERAIELKRDHLDSPDPTAWTEDEIRTVLTEIFPRRVATTADDARLLAPAMTLYFSFLLSTGRFRSPLTDPSLTGVDGGAGHRGAAGPRGPGPPLDGRERRPLRPRARGGRLGPRTARRVHGALQRPVLRGAGRHHRRRGRWRGSGRRRRPGRRPDPAGAGVAFGLGAGTDGGEGASPFARIWPAALGHAPDLAALSRGPFDAQGAAELFERSVLLRRARQLLRWVGDGRPVTSTGALRLSDTTAVLDLLRDLGARGTAVDVVGARAASCCGCPWSGWATSRSAGRA